MTSKPTVVASQLRTTQPLEYYTRPGPMTDLAEHSALLDNLPPDIPALCQVVQNTLLHIFWAKRYGVESSQVRKEETEIRSVADKLTRLQALKDLPLTVPRPPRDRVVGNCRDFAVTLCALLRHQARPARARCGFATYFEPDKYVDHWVCEYWQADEERWVRVDAQLDGLQRRALKISFSPYDVPHGRFLSGGQAWQLCRAGQADPDRFGFSDEWGLWFVQSDLVRDLAALNKMELLPWDCWALADAEPDGTLEEEMALLDRVAALTGRAENEVFAEIRELYEQDSRLRVPAIIKSYGETGARMVDITGKLGMNSTSRTTNSNRLTDFGDRGRISL